MAPGNYQSTRTLGRFEGFIVVVGMTIGAVLFIGGAGILMYAASVRLSPDPVRDAQIAAEEAARVEADRLAKLGPPGPALDATMVARGKRLYEAACVACHGIDAKGVANMGKDLVGSRFSKKTNDIDLAKFIAKGREATARLSTTQRPMPPRGGRADYTDEHLADVVGYLRYLQDSRRVSGSLPEVTVALLDAPDPVPPVAVAPASNGGAALDAQAIGRGKKVFNSCIACHGKTGVGVPKTGADLVHSSFVKSKTDDELLAFVKKGRQPGDAESQMKLAMPAKGGNPSLKDEQLKDVIVYLRSLQQAAADPK